MTDRSAEHWYPTAAYLYVLHLDGPALAWEYLRRNPDYRRDWLRRRRRPDTAQAWGLRLLEDPALDARDAHPAWFPDHDAVVQVYPDDDPPPEAHAFEFWRVPGRKQLIHDGKRLVLVSHWPWPRLPRLRRRPVPGPRRPRCWNCTPCRRSTRPWRARHCAKWPKGCSAPMPSPPTGTRTAPYVPACGGWYVVAMR